MTPTWSPSAEGDILIRGMASWFGGNSDCDDNGETASGVDNSKLGVMGCALPMVHSNGRIVTACIGSPLPDMPYISTRVQIFSGWGAPPAAGSDLFEVPLIDVGPELSLNRPIDLTPSLFDALGGDHTGPVGTIPVTARILGAAKYLLPQS